MQGGLGAFDGDFLPLSHEFGIEGEVGIAGCRVVAKQECLGF